MQGRSLGLTSMQERLRLVHGELSIYSQPKGGTTIHARVPFRSSSESVQAAGRNSGFADKFTGTPFFRAPVAQLSGLGRECGE